MAIVFRFQTANKIAADWTTANPVLLLGEMGFESDTNSFKFGDGTTAWTSLPYAGGGGGGITALTGDVTAAGTGSVAATIAAGAVSLAKMAALAAFTMIGNNTGGAATPIALTAAQVKTMLAISLSTDVTGTLQSAQMPAFTGDVTNAGLAMTIPAGTVTLAKQANVATATVFYRKTAGTGAPEVQTLATLKTDLGLTGTNSGDQTITLTGDVTGSGTGSFAATIAAGAVTLAKMANIATASFLGRTTAATGVPEVLTATQATALLSVATTSLKGLVPAPGSATGLFLKDDLTWAAASGGGITSLTTDVVASGTGAVVATIQPAAVTLAKMANLAANSIIGNNTGAGATPLALTAAQVNTLLATVTLAGAQTITGAKTFDVGITQTFDGPVVFTDTQDFQGVANFLDSGYLWQNALDPTRTASIKVNNASPVGYTQFVLPITAGAIVVDSATQTLTNKSIVATQLTGTLQAAQMPAFTGDVTNAGLAMTIPAGTITLAKQANMATASVVYRKTAGAGAPEVQTLATLKTDLGLTGTNSGDQTITLTGDVTGSGTGSFAATIAAGAVTLAKQANIATGSIMGRVTAATGVQEVLTPAQVKTLLAIAASDVSGLAAVATAGTFASLTSIPTTLAGYGITDAVPNTGSKTIAGSTTFSGNAIIADANFFLQDDADPTKQLKWQLSSISTGTTRTITVPDFAGGVLVLDTGAQTVGGAKTFTNAIMQDNNFGIFDNLDATKLVQFQVAGLTTGTTRTLTVPDASGTIMLTSTVLAAAQEPAHTGDVTNTAGSLAMAIAANAVTLAQMAQISTARFLGRTTAATGNVESLTATQATALLDVATTTLKGLVPAPATATGKVLRDDLTWVTVSAGAGGSTTQVQYNSGGSLAGATEVLIENNQLRLVETTTFTAPAIDGIHLIAIERDGKTSVPAFTSHDAVAHELMVNISAEGIALLQAIPSSTSMTAIGTPAPTAIGVATAFVPATTTLYTKTPVEEWLVTTAAATAIAGFRTLNGMMTVGGGAAGKGGFKWFARWGPATGVATTTMRAACGLRGLTSAPTDVDPSSLVTCAFFGWDAADTNIQLMSNDASGACTKIDLGASFPVPTADRTKIFDCWLYSPPGTTLELYYRIKDLATGSVASGVVTTTTDLPAATARLSPFGYCSVGGTSSVIGFGLHAMQWQQVVVD